MEISGVLQSFFTFLKEWYWVPLLLIYMGVISTILIENRNPTKTIAWMLVIIFVPFFGLVLYYFFGQKFVRVNKMKKLYKKQTLQLEQKWKELDPIMESVIQDIHGNIGDLSKVYRLMKTQRLSSPTLYNKVDLLLNGEQKFPRLIADLENAIHSIHLEYYIFDPDVLGLKVLEVLERKAREGVIVRLIVDSFGSPQMVNYMRKRKDSKILFYPFLPVTFTSLANSNYRNHRKIAIIDGKIGYVGGINIAEKYVNEPDTPMELYWRDTSMRIEGAAVNLLQISFWNSWDQTDGEPFLLREGYVHLDQKMEESKGEAAVGFVTSDPASIGPFNMEAMLLAIGEANTSICLCTPYYIPSQELERALIIAASSGVNVELMIPASSDSFIVQHASFSYLKPILERGVKVYLYNKGFLHAKTMTVDDKMSFIGTVNLDIRSFYINYEIVSVVSDANFSKALQKQFEKDKEHATLLTLEDWQSRSRYKRAIDSLCRLLAPLL